MFGTKTETVSRGNRAAFLSKLINTAEIKLSRISNVKELIDQEFKLNGKKV